MTVYKMDGPQKFRIPCKDLEIDGQKIVVRGMTYSETKRFREAYKADKESAIPLVASMCTLDPRLTLEEASDAPTHILMAINAAAFELSGMRGDGADEKKV